MITKSQKSRKKLPIFQVKWAKLILFIEKKRRIFTNFYQSGIDKTPLFIYFWGGV